MSEEGKAPDQPEASGEIQDTQEGVHQETSTANTAASTTEETTTVSWVNENGEWNREAFGDLKEHTNLDKYKTPMDLLKGANGKDELIGKKVDDLLSSDNPEIVEALKARNGVPKSVDGYEISFPDGFEALDNEVQEDVKAYVGEMAQFALENNIPKQHLEVLAKHDLERSLELQQQQQAEQTAALEQAREQLRKEWGPAQFDNKVKKTMNQARYLGLEDLIPVLENNPPMLKKFHESVSSIIDNDKLIGDMNPHTQTDRDMIADLDDRMITYEGPTTDAAYQKMLTEKMTIMKRMGEMS